MAKTMVSWQAFPSLLPSSRAPRVSLAPKTPFPFPFKRRPRRLVYVGSSLKVHNPLFSVGKFLWNKLMKRFYWSIQSKCF